MHVYSTVRGELAIKILSVLDVSSVKANISGVAHHTRPALFSFFLFFLWTKAIITFELSLFSNVFARGRVRCTAELQRFVYERKRTL